MRKPTQAAVVGTAAAALLVSTFTVAASATPENAAHHTKPKSNTAATTLGALGKRADLRIGTAVDMSALASDAPYRAKAAGSSPRSPRRTS